MLSTPNARREQRAGDDVGDDRLDAEDFQKVRVDSCQLSFCSRTSLRSASRNFGLGVIVRAEGDFGDDVFLVEQGLGVVEHEIARL
jgi:hypothetical protein